MKNKSKIWFILWGIALLLGSLFSAACKVLGYFKKGVVLQTLPYADYQLFLLLIYLPLCLIPLLGASHYYAVKEKNKPIKLATMCLIIHHIICIVAVLLQILLY